MTTLIEHVRDHDYPTPGGSQNFICQSEWDTGIYDRPAKLADVALTIVMLTDLNIYVYLYINCNIYSLKCMYVLLA